MAAEARSRAPFVCATFPRALSVSARLSCSRISAVAFISASPDVFVLQQTDLGSAVIQEAAKLLATEVRRRNSGSAGIKPGVISYTRCVYTGCAAPWGPVCVWDGSWADLRTVRKREDCCDSPAPRAWPGRERLLGCLVTWNAEQQFILVKINKTKTSCLTAERRAETADVRHGWILDTQREKDRCLNSSLSQRRVRS